MPHTYLIYFDFDCCKFDIIVITWWCRRMPFKSSNENTKTKCNNLNHDERWTSRNEWKKRREDSESTHCGLNIVTNDELIELNSTHDCCTKTIDRKIVHKLRNTCLLTARVCCLCVSRSHCISLAINLDTCARKWFIFGTAILLPYMSERLSAHRKKCHERSHRSLICHLTRYHLHVNHSKNAFMSSLCALRTQISDRLRRALD